MTHWTVALQVPLSMRFSQQEYWRGLPFPSPGDLPDTGIKYMSPVSPALQEDSLPLSHPGSPYYYIMAKSQHSLYIPIVINNFILVSFLPRYLKSVFALYSDFYIIRGNNKLYYAAAVKSLQSCPTLYDPIDGSPPGSPIPGILQARTLEWVAISFSNA